MKKLILIGFMMILSSCAFVKKPKSIELLKPQKVYNDNVLVYLSDVSSPRYLDTDDMAYIYKNSLRYFAKHRFPCSLNCTIKNYLLEALPYLTQKDISSYKLSIYIYEFEPEFYTVHRGRMLLKARFYLKHKNTYKIKDFNYNKDFYAKDFNALMNEENKALDDMVNKLNHFIRKSVIMDVKEGKDG